MRYEGVTSCEPRRAITDKLDFRTMSGSLVGDDKVYWWVWGLTTRAQQTVQKGSHGTAYTLLVLVVAFCQFWLLTSLAGSGSSIIKKS